MICIGNHCPASQSARCVIQRPLSWCGHIILRLSSADQVFPHRESFFNGYLVILSNDPIVVREETLRNSLNSDDELWQEIRQHVATETPEDVFQLMDVPQLPGGRGKLVITDDWPVVEYPAQLRRILTRNPLPFRLPQPETKYSLHAAPESR